VDERGLESERAIAEKRADYFAAGTLAIWDVDILSDDVVRIYRASAPTSPTVYRRGDTAEAEPAVPGWSMPVNDLFPD
jgi:Uma2 family endonuclease